MEQSAWCKSRDIPIGMYHVPYLWLTIMDTKDNSDLGIKKIINLERMV